MAVDRLQTLARADAHDDLVLRLDAQVRDLVRREGVDPQREAVVVRRIAEDVVRGHDELSLTGAVAPIADDGAMVGGSWPGCPASVRSSSSTTRTWKRSGSTLPNGSSSPGVVATADQPAP